MDIRQLLCPSDEEVHRPQLEEEDEESSATEGFSKKGAKRVKTNDSYQEEIPSPNATVESTANPSLVHQGPYIAWNQRQWTEFIEDCLIYLSTTRDADPRMFLEKREPPPGKRILFFSTGHNKSLPHIL